MSKPKKSSRNFAIRLYANDIHDVEKIVEKVNHYAFILHDKDVWKDNTEDHSVGDIKKPHYHLLLNFTENQTINDIHRLVYKFLPHAGEEVEFLNSGKQGFLYLTHKTPKAIDEGKYQYEDSEIYSDKPSFWQEKEVQEQIRHDKQDWTALLLNDLIEHSGSLKRDIWLKYAKDYGRDFILNYKRVKEFADYVLYETIY